MTLANIHSLCEFKLNEFGTKYFHSGRLSLMDLANIPSLSGGLCYMNLANILSLYESLSISEFGKYL